MLLAELEVWHSRPVTPTRRVALGHLVLPVEPAPGFGGLLLAAVVAAHLPHVDTDLVPDVHRLLDQVWRGDRITQPRLRHRYQVDRHGLAVSVHRLVGEGDNVRFDLRPNGSPLVQVLGAVYAVERLESGSRDLLGFPVGTGKVSKRDVTVRYRTGVRRVHPDHGGDEDIAYKAIADLAEARKILTP